MPGVVPKARDSAPPPYPVRVCAMLEPPPAGVGPPWGLEMVCIRYWPLVSPGGFASLLLLENAQLSVKKPEPMNVNHISMVMLPVAGRTVGEILAWGPPWG